MSHEVYVQTNGFHSINYRGAKPWHGLGQDKSSAQTYDEFIAGVLDYGIGESELTFTTQHGETITYPNRRVLFHDQTGEPFSIVSDGYKIFPPRECREFFRDVCEKGELILETIGSLCGGARFWALARIPDDSIGKVGTEILEGDKTLPYILIASSVDKTLATTAKQLATRVVCNNTLGVGLTEKNRGVCIKIRHKTKVNTDQVRKALGLETFDDDWARFAAELRALADKPVSEFQAKAYFSELLRPKAERDRTARANLQANDLDGLLKGDVKATYRAVDTDKAKPERAIKGLAALMESYRHAPGARPGNAYGLVQGVTHYLDHVRGKDQDKRLTSSWFGQGEQLKTRAVEMARSL